MRCRASRRRRRIAVLSVMVLGLAPTLAGEIDATMFPLRWDCPWEQGFTMVDLDHDDVLDMIAASETEGICVRPGLGDGTFGPRTTYEGGWAAFPVTADFNGDDSPDVVAVQ